MTDASFGDLLVRMVVSLAVVFGLIAVAYQVMRRRQGGGGTSRGIRAASTTIRRDGSKRRSSSSATSRRGVRVLSRVGINRTTQIVAVQVGDEVLLVAASEQGTPTVMKSMSVDAWEAANEIREERIPITAAAGSSGHGAPAGAIGATAADRPEPRGFLDALREATVRRA